MAKRKPTYQGSKVTTAGSREGAALKRQADQILQERKNQALAESAKRQEILTGPSENDRFKGALGAPIHRWDGSKHVVLRNVGGRLAHEDDIIMTGHTMDHVASDLATRAPLYKSGTPTYAIREGAKPVPPPGLVPPSHEALPVPSAIVPEEAKDRSYQLAEGFHGPAYHPHAAQAYELRRAAAVGPEARGTEPVTRRKTDLVLNEDVREMEKIPATFNKKGKMLTPGETYPKPDGQVILPKGTVIARKGEPMPRRKAGSVEYATALPNARNEYVYEGANTAEENLQLHNRRVTESQPGFVGPRQPLPKPISEGPSPALSFPVPAAERWPDAARFAKSKIYRGTHNPVTSETVDPEDAPEKPVTDMALERLATGGNEDVVTKK